MACLCFQRIYALHLRFVLEAPLDHLHRTLQRPFFRCPTIPLQVQNDKLALSAAHFIMISASEQIFFFLFCKHGPNTLMSSVCRDSISVNRTRIRVIHTPRSSAGYSRSTDKYFDVVSKTTTQTLPNRLPWRRCQIAGSCHKWYGLVKADLIIFLLSQHTPKAARTITAQKSKSFLER
jgi:hypothetical protein